METGSHKIVFYSDSDFSFLLSEYENNTFLHCEVSSWSLTVLKNMYREFARFCEIAPPEFYTVTPNPRFAKLFGGASLGFMTKDGITYEVIKWELKQLSS